ncbi:hypothetical protein LCGC14_2238410, partial [marine sediment metagenome]|nr:hypothetical protein [Candidatus Aminicenantes bacterium]
MGSLNLEAMLYKDAQDWRWRDLARPAFISPVNRESTIKLLPDEDVLKFREMIIRFDNKRG